MANLYRLSLRIWPAFNEASKRLPALQRSYVSKISQTRVCYYCKRYGLYDEEEETPCEYNKRGAYIEKPRSSFTPRRTSWDRDDDDDYDGDDVYGSTGEPRFRHFQRQQSYNRREPFGESRKDGLWDGNEDDFKPIPSRSYDSQGPMYNRRSDFHGSAFGPQRNNMRFGGPSAYGRNPSGFDMLRDQNNLPKYNFSSEQLPQINKNLYKEHSDVTGRSVEEIEAYRKSMSIRVRGADIPRPIMKFSELNVSESLMQIIKEEDFPNPTAIQAQGWPIVLSGQDMIGISQTGSGKTLVFILPAMLHIMNQAVSDSMPYNVCCPQALVLSPTRELAQQTYTVSNRFRHSCGIRTSCVYGGASKMGQLSKMRGTHICVATPGRLIDFLMEGSVNLKACTYLVLDEADRMLDMGFEPQIRQIINQIRPDRQTLMWSATWPKEVQTLAEDFLSDYVHVTIGSEDLCANPNIVQNIYVMSEFEKTQRLLSLLDSLMEGGPTKVLIFAQTKRTVDFLTDKLNRQRIFALAIHGDVSQSRRDRVLDRFRHEKSSILIATDVAARGLDVTDIQHVINFDFPTNIDDYIHRIGRTARGTKTGVAHSFFTDENSGVARDLINVLEKAGQPVVNELLPFVSRTGVRNKRFNALGRTGYRGRSYGW